MKQEAITLVVMVIHVANAPLLNIKKETIMKIIQTANGSKSWFLNGKYHREDGPAIEDADGEKQWFLNGQHHREDGPAIEYANGDKYWFLNGKLHREDGPAIEWADGGKHWFLNGQKIKCSSQQEFEKLMKMKAFW